MTSISPVELLRRQYMQLVDPQNLPYPAGYVLKLPETQSSIYNRMFNESLVSHLPPERYQFRVLKKLLKGLEDSIDDPNEDDISDNLSSAFANLMSKPLISESDAAQQKVFVTYTAPSTSIDAPSTVLLETPWLLGSFGTTGLRTWEASLHLASYLYSLRSSLAGASILELGAGTGLVSIFCAKYFRVKRVLATDGSLEVAENLRTNLSANGLEGDGIIDAKILRWGHALIGGEADLRENGDSFEYALGADVTYDSGSIPALVATMRDLFEIYPRLQVLISATLRNKATWTHFLDACEKNHFLCDRIDFPTTKAESQIGLFLPPETTIELFRVTHTGKKIDPFALN